jgi:hypothetical protein
MMPCFLRRPSRQILPDHQQRIGGPTYRTPQVTFWFTETAKSGPEHRLPAPPESKSAGGRENRNDRKGPATATRRGPASRPGKIQVRTLRQRSPRDAGVPRLRKPGCMTIHNHARPRACALMPHTARQVAHDVADHGRGCTPAQSPARRPAMAPATPVDCTRSGGGSRTPSIFSLTLSDARVQAERSPSRRSARMVVTRHSSARRADQGRSARGQHRRERLRATAHAEMRTLRSCMLMRVSA